MNFNYDSDISNNSKEWMKLLGNFTPTSLPERKELKGLTLDPQGDHVKTYTTAESCANSPLPVLRWLTGWTSVLCCPHKQQTKFNNVA